MEGQHWSGRALCRDYDPEIWFPLPKDEAGYAAAKLLCRSCPVMSMCLEWALASGEDSGVWGGKSEAERRSLKRQRAGRRLRVSA